MKGKVAVVVGGSRGIGAASVEMFAGRGAHVVCTYARRVERARKAAESVAGNPAVVRRLDVCDDASVAAFVAYVEQEGLGIDYLVFAVAAGMEPGKGIGHAFKANDEAPAALVSALSSSLRPGAVVIYLTSHEAHFYGRVPSFEGYAAVAASKHAGERRMKTLEPLLAPGGVRLNVISGDVVPDSATGKLLEYKAPGLLDARRALVGALPTARDFAERIEALCRDPLPGFGAVSYVWEPAGYPREITARDNEGCASDDDML